MSNPQDNTKHPMCIICSEFGTLGINPEVYNRTLTWHNAGHPEVGGVGQSPAHSRNLNIEGEIDDLMTDVYFRGQTGRPDKDMELAEAINEAKHALIELVANRLHEIHMQATRHLRATDDKEYLIFDLEKIAALSSNKQGGRE